MAEREDPCRIKLKNVRLSYPHLWKPRAFSGDGNSEPKYQASFLMDPNTASGKRNIALIEDAMEHAKDEKWPKGAPKLSAAKICLRSGDDMEEPQEAYEGQMYISTSEARRPRVLDIDGEDVRDGDEGAPYAGCFVDAIVRIWPQDNKFGKRLNASLLGVKFREDGDALTNNKPIDASDFNDDDDDEPRSRRSSKDDDRSSRSRGSSKDDEDEKPRSRSRGREDDEDEKPRSRGRSDKDEDEPRSRRSSREDDEDEPPRRRRSNADDEDEKPRSRRSSRDDDGDDEPRRRRSSADDDEPRSRRTTRGRDDDLT